MDDVDYTSVEQFYQHEKATQCGFPGLARKIMSKSNPWYIKVVGNRVETNEEWEKNRLKTLYKGIFAKFDQNIPLRQALLNTMGLNLYKATTDLYYACGIDLDSPKWETKDWPGQNVTGQILMKVRGEFLAEESLTDSFSENTLMNLTSVEDNHITHDIDTKTSPMVTDDHTKTVTTERESADWPTVTEANGSFSEVAKEKLCC